ncbi:alpha/beta hydrolase [Mycobacterium sp. NPDC051804]|uniref:alpha/beta hydrolase n=1 Tax=Mycobacterium sp. NPDC051804 TaxID=3364295 RepID=UPI00378E20D8
MTEHMRRIRHEIVRAALRECRPPLTSHRISVRALTALTRPVDGLQWQREVIGGVPVERTVSVGANATLIYLHGGAYGLGSAHGYRGVVGRLAEAAWMAAVMPDYSMVSEAVALEEMVEVYTALLTAGMDPRTTVIAGDSAGGGLALALAMTLRDRGIALPAALGLIRPRVDLALVGGNFAGLPPIVVQSAGEDPLLVGGAAVDVEHQQLDGLWHDIHLHTGVRVEADFALAELGARLRAHVQDRVETT